MAGMRTQICILCRNLQRWSLGHHKFSPAPLSVIPVRHVNTNKHYDPKWRRHRGYKFFKINLPDYQEMKRKAGVTLDEMEASRRRQGLPPQREGRQERNITLACSGTVLEPYKPTEGDGKISKLQSPVESVKKIRDDRKGKKTIQQYEEDFDTGNFASEALEIYLQAHEYLQDIKKNKEELHDLVTEKAYPEMVWLLEKKTFRWKLGEVLEVPRVVQIKTLKMSQDNVYSQITVRLHTSQMIAVYDRFGRLQYGNENVIKDILEYVVFEKHVSEMYSKWRIHGKIIPEGVPTKTEVLRTMKRPNVESTLKEEPKIEKETAQQTG